MDARVRVAPSSTTAIPLRTASSVLIPTLRACCSLLEKHTKEDVASLVSATLADWGGTLQLAALCPTFPHRKHVV